MIAFARSARSFCQRAAELLLSRGGRVQDNAPLASLAPLSEGGRAPFVRGRQSSFCQRVRETLVCIRKTAARHKRGE